MIRDCGGLVSLTREVGSLTAEGAPMMYTQKIPLLSVIWPHVQQRESPTTASSVLSANYVEGTTHSLFPGKLIYFQITAFAVNS